MKKLLSFLGIFTMTSMSVATVVACGESNPYERKDENGDSILINSLNNIGNGELTQITASDVLWRLINENGPANRNKFAADLLKLLNASILANAGDFFDGDADKEKDDNKNKVEIDKENINYNYGLVETLVDKYNDLNTKIDNEIKRERDSDDYSGKNGDEKWLDMLKAKFPGFSDKEVLEKKYKQDKLISGSLNVSTVLLEVLLETDQDGVTWVPNSQTKQSLSYFKNLKNKEEREKYIKDNLKEVAQIVNATKAKPEDWIPVPDSYKVEDLEKIKDEEVKFDVPNDIGELTKFDNSSRKGMLSNSQKFFLNKYYETKAPIAISEATIPFASGKKFEDGINEELFKEPGNDRLHENIKKFLNGVFKDATNAKANWREALVHSDSSIYESVTFKQNANLLTLSGGTDYSQILRHSVYDYILGGKPAEISLDFSKGDIEKINRATGSDKMYGKIQGMDGFLIFIDTDGIHIVNIEGYEYLKDAATDGKQIKGVKDGKIDKDTLNELNLFREFSKLSDEQKVSNIQNNDKSKYVIDGGLNSTISNKYLRYLVNNSLVKGMEGSSTSFDIMSQVNAWSKSTDISESGEYLWVNAVYDYFFNITSAGASKEEENKDKDEVFVSKFLQFNSGKEGRPSEVSKAMEKWFIGAIKNIKATVFNDPIVEYIQKDKEWSSEILKNTVSTYPKGIFKALEHSAFAKSIRDKFIAVKKGSSLESFKFSIPNDYFNKLLGGIK